MSRRIAAALPSRMLFAEAAPGAVTVAPSPGQVANDTGTLLPANPGPLHQEFATLRKAALDVVRAAQEAKRGLSPEERQADDQRFARCEQIRATIEEHNRFAAMALAANQAVLQAAQATPDLPQLFAAAQGQGQAQGLSFGDRRQQLAQQVRDEVNQFIRQGSEQKFVVITTSGSSVLLPQIPTTPVVVRRIANPIMALIMARGYTPLYTAGTETIPVPLFDDSGNDAANTAEDSDTEADQDPTVTNPTLGQTLYDSKAFWLSNTVLNAANYDLLAYVEPMLQKRIDHKQQSDWLATLVASGTTGRTTALAAGPTYAELLAWEHSLPIAYRSDRGYIFADTLMQAVRGMVDTLGRPLYQQSMRDEEPDKFFGAPVFLSDTLAAVAAGATPGILASGEALKVRICTNRRLARYVNQPGHPDQTGLELFVNAGFAFIPAGVRKLVMGQS